MLNGAVMTARGRGSGVETRMEYWMVWRFRDGKATRWTEYTDRAEAVEALGQRE